MRGGAWATTNCCSKKGIFPYEWFDSFEKFDWTELPPQDAFYSELEEEGITDEEYERAQNVWTAMDCKTFQNYHDLYLKTDVVLLADVFENFRDLSMRTYGLDPAHYLTTPSLTWDACLRHTNVDLELITDPEMFLFFESAMRGGISVISNRYARANNPYLKPEDYVSDQPHSYSGVPRVCGARGNKTCRRPPPPKTPPPSNVRNPFCTRRHTNH
jgi:hypothetical protein